MKNRTNSMIIIALTVLLITAISVFAVRAAQTSATQFSNNSDVQAFQKSIAELEKKQQELKNKLREVQSDRYTAQQRLAYFNELIAGTEKKIDTAKSLIEALNVQISQKEEEIAEKEAQIAQKAGDVSDTRNRFLMLVRAQYESDDVGILGVVLGADGMSDMLSRIENMANILNYNSKLLSKFKTEKSELEAMKATLEASRTELAKSMDEQVKYADELAKEEASLNDQKGDADKYLASLRKTESEINAEYSAALKAEEAENQRLETLLRQLAKDSQSDYVGGKFAWPVSTSIKRISSYYGWRTYYYYGKKVTDFHRGIDIPSSTGTDIFASQSGKVVAAVNLHSSYGNYIVIDHGGGYSTLYAHCHKLLVKVGDTVAQGDHIAEMGTTGQSTGPHLHFEIRIDGKTQDPLSDGFLTVPK